MFTSLPTGGLAFVKGELDGIRWAVIDGSFNSFAFVVSHSRSLECYKSHFVPIEDSVGSQDTVPKSAAGLWVNL
jgi:hypothetical protein